MAKKGAEKNTRNKAEHARLQKRKKEKLRIAKENNKAKLKAILDKSKEAKAQNS